MRIEEINIPDTMTNNGLKNISMKNLKRVVLIVGKNGAGKTRLLHLIKNSLDEKPSHKDVANAEIKIKNLTDIFKGINKSDDFETHKDTLKKQLSSEEMLFKKESLIKTDEKAVRYTAEYINIKNLTLEDPYKMSPQEIDKYSGEVDKFSVDSLAYGALPKIKKIYDKHYYLANDDVITDENKRRKAKANLDRLCNLIKLLLGTELKNIDGELTLFDKNFSNLDLSDGEKKIIQLIVSLYSQESTLEEMILMFDEPENHLHPSIIIEIIERFQRIVKKGQLWIATHSIALTSYFLNESVYFMDKGILSYAGSIPEKVLDSLIGNDERKMKLLDFIDLPNRLALIRFAEECLLESKVIPGNRDDKQTEQFKGFIHEHLNDTTIPRVLDFGAGKGRLLSNLSESCSKENKKVSDLLDYYAYDIDSANMAECKNVIEEVYNDSTGRYFNETYKLVEMKFDIILMCNVLHEINPSDWINVFNSPTGIYNMLNDTGILLIIEDCLMPHGEKAFSSGFIVLNEEEIKVLFNIDKECNGYKTYDYNEDKRLMAHAIEKKHLPNITNSSIKNCIRLLHKNTLKKINITRDGPVNYKNGRKHGFLVQQLANCCLVLEDMDKKRF
jgi:ABC-type cobalamin/Fe3+-siderophores transport system ATPase subunit